MTVVLFANVSPFRRLELLAACSHLPYRVWSEPDGETYKIFCDKEQGREASGDAGGAGPRSSARAATRGPGSNPGRSTISILNFFRK